jgi:hypothetical protein
MTKKIIVGVLLLIGFLFIFTGLNNDYLWEDEAETGAIAKNMLRTFWPNVKTANKNIITQEAGHDSNKDNIWTLQTWLPHFTAATTFKLFGVNTWTARFPFAITGFLSLVCAFYFTLRQKKDFTQAAATLLFLVFSLLFILHVRQCRYYALSIFFSILWIFSFWRIADHKKYFWFSALSTILLFHAQYFMAVALSAAGFVSAIILKKDRQKFIKMSLCLFGVTAVFTLPWIIYVRLWEKIDSGSANFGYILNLVINLLNLNHFILPVALLLFLVIYRKTFDTFDKYLFLIGILYVIFLSACPLFPDIRYLVVLVFWGAYICGAIFKNTLRSGKLLSLILVCTLIFSNIWSLPYWFIFKPYLPATLKVQYKDLRFDMLKYFYELTHPTSGPVKTVVLYLNKNAKPGETIFLSYEAEPFIFYTDLRIVRELPFTKKPDWIILRGKKNTWHWWLKWVLITDKINQPRDGKYVWNFNIKKEPTSYWEKRKIYLEKYIKENNYAKIVLPAENTFWENRPSILRHRFGLEKIENPLIIYRLNK